MEIQVYVNAWKENASPDNLLAIFNMFMLDAIEMAEEESLTENEDMFVIFDKQAERWKEFAIAASYDSTWVAPNGYFSLMKQTVPKIYEAWMEWAR